MSIQEFSTIFSLDPAKFPYTKQTISTRRNARAALDNQLFFDLVLSEVAQIKTSTRLYPPRNTSDLRHLHEAIESCPVDLLKKQCCIYYLLRDWNSHAEYAESQLIPSNYCSLMDSYWYLDNQQYADALDSLTTPGLTPNFATKIMTAFRDSGNHTMVVSYVQTLQTSLDTETKLKLYLDALTKVDIESAIYFTRTVTPELRRQLFESVIDVAKSDPQTALVLVKFPFDTTEEQWVYDLLSQYSGTGLETLIMRLTLLGKTIDAVQLREKHGGGQLTLNHAVRQQVDPVELKLASQ